MAGPGARAGGGGHSAAGFVAAGDLGRFRRLVDLTVLTTLALIILGGVVRVSESGLGCGPGGSGTEGWPLCGGEAIPLLSQSEVIIEFSHRLLAAVVTALIAILAWTAYKRLRHLHWPLRTSIAAGVLVLIQAGLGGLTVEKNLAEELGAAHLGLAMLLLGLLLWMAVRARVELTAAEREATPEHDAEEMATDEKPVRALKPFAAGAAVLLLCAIVAGGYVAGTEEEGVGSSGRNINGAHMACGDTFPTCLDGRVAPFGESRLSDIHLTHRFLVYGATAAILLMIAIALRRGSRSRLLAVAGGLLLLQLLLGALNVWLGEHATLIVAHLFVATLLWGTVLLIAFRLAWAPAPAIAPWRTPTGATPTMREGLMEGGV
jgi:heme A synthase